MLTRVSLLIFLALFFNKAQAEVNFIDQFGKDNLAWENKTLASDISDYLLYSMLGASVVYTYDQKGAKHALAASGALVVNAGLNQLVKHAAGRERPDGSDRLSFWSGHSAASAASASILCLANKKLCIPAYALAVTVGGLRVAAKKHYLTDVGVGLFTGGGIGYFGPQLVVKW